MTTEALQDWLLSQLVHAFTNDAVALQHASFIATILMHCWFKRGLLNGIYLVYVT